MVFVLYGLVSSIVFVYFLMVKHKRLHSLELVFYWCLASLLIQNRSAIYTMNLKIVEIPQPATYEFSHLLIRLVLYPLVTLFCLNEMATASSNAKKVTATVKYAALLLGLEWISDWLGVYNHVKPYLLWSALFWVGFLIAMGIAMRIFRGKFYKGYPWL